MRFLLLALLLAPASVFAQEVEQPAEPVRPSRICEGDGCDAYLPILEKNVRFEDVSARRKWGTTLGALSGALIGEEIAGAPGAIAFGALGAFTGYDYIDRERWEANAKAHDQAWQRGDDIYYNPAHRLPLHNAHWLHAGPALPSGVIMNK